MQEKLIEKILSVYEFIQTSKPYLLKESFLSVEDSEYKLGLALMQYNTKSHVLAYRVTRLLMTGFGH